MKIPSRSSLPHTIAKCIYTHGPMTTKQVIDLLPDANPRRISGALHKMWTFGQVLKPDDGSRVDKFYLPHEMRRYFDMLEFESTATPGQIAEHRYVAPFKPIQAKYIPSAEAKRNDALPAREIYFKSASGANSPYWNGAVV